MGKAGKAQEEVERSGIGFRTERFEEEIPGAAILEGAVPGILLFGVFGQCMGEQFCEPLLNADVDELRKVAARLLTGTQRPIVLMPRLPGAPVADSVAPHNPDLGVMLSYAPLHTLLFGLDG